MHIVLPMATTVEPETISQTVWDFSSVLTALGSPPAPPTARSISDFEIDSNTPSSCYSRTPSSLTRTLSQDDDEETPKATPSLDFGSNLGDLDQVLAFLGYAVSTKGPVTDQEIATAEDVDLIEVFDDTPTKTRPRTKTSLSKQSKSYKSDTQVIQTCQKDIEYPQQAVLEPHVESVLEAPAAIKISAKRAEIARRSVLDNYLGSSPETSTSISTSPKAVKAKKTNTWAVNGLSPSSLPPPAVTLSRKRASFIVSADKKVQLIIELHKKFSNDVRSLSSLSTPSLDLDPKGVHVFVDISNILIGFHDALKKNRQLTRHSRIARQTLSFHNLSLILERGRPVAKRFLAGSDDIDCTQEARLLGYTTHILQRVDKPDYSRPPGTRNGKKSGLTSSDTDSGTPARTKRAEQAVDEVLHLGMLQSLLDVEKPSTIVLASGDAAKAEFSDGFLKQVERALLKGWKVEVVAFQATTGFAYRDPNWRSRWGKAFKLIPLDEFAELLHVPYEGANF